MKKEYLGCLILVFTLISCTNYDYSHILVKKVIDGDTIILGNGETLRYIGIDTPEVRIKKEGKFIYAPQPFSLEAKEYNRRLAEGKYVKIEFDVVKKDRYGRLLGYCFLGDTMVNAKLLKEGFAVAYTYPPNVKYVDYFLNLQNNARMEGKGFWGAYETIDHTQANKYINQVRSVRGKIIKTSESQKCIYLNFGQNWRQDFTIVVFKKDSDYFYRKNIDPQKFYLGKVVEVTGKIRDYNGPEIIVSHPMEISIIEEED